MLEVGREFPIRGGHRPAGHQKNPRLLHDQPARLHGHGGGCGVIGFGDVSSYDARILQVPALFDRGRFHPPLSHQ